MTARLNLLAKVLVLAVFLVGGAGVLCAEAAPAPDRSYDASPPLRLDSFYFLAQEAALELFRQGCLEVKVVALPDTRGTIQILAACIEWREIQPASQ